ncbi:MAG: IS200/IS605 family transposase [Cyclobacteriaceae bacterium]|nr:IS200/IS605 family transposase [Cyclobacteriaceae bacterium]
MSQSLVKIYLHITFSTKYHEPLIFEEIEKELHNYLAEICTSIECHPIKIGGYDDHVHIVCSLSRKIALMNLIEELKTSSSGWMKSKDVRLKKFYWQDGYYAVSVNPADLQELINYVENQREHHKKVTYKEEVIALLKKNRIAYDERYVWD